MDARVNGQQTLESQRRSLSYTELQGSYFLTNFQKSDKSPYNLASFADAGWDAQIPDIHLVIVVAPATLDNVKHQNASLTFVCSNDCYIEGNLATVAVFRDRVLGA